jgi:hypothetical protein
MAEFDITWYRSRLAPAAVTAVLPHQPPVSCYHNDEACIVSEAISHQVEKRSRYCMPYPGWFILHDGQI